MVTEPSLLMRSGALCDDVWRSARLSGAVFFAPLQTMRFACAITNYPGAGMPPILSDGVPFSERTPASAMMILTPPGAGKIILNV